jgi:hypothetical protein
VFAAVGVPADDLVAALVQHGNGDGPDWLVLVGLDDDEVLSVVFRSLISMNRASSDGSSMWSPFSLSAQ